MNLEVILPIYGPIIIICAKGTSIVIELSTNHEVQRLSLVDLDLHRLTIWELFWSPLEHELKMLFLVDLQCLRCGGALFKPATFLDCLSIRRPLNDPLILNLKPMLLAVVSAIDPDPIDVDISVGLKNDCMLLS